jgi:Holliday junction resolvase-like predicted endonuclease
MHNPRDRAVVIERNLIIAVLRLAEHGAVSHELVNKEARIPSNLVQRLLSRWHNEGLVYVGKDFIEVNSLNRLKLAIQAISLGADPERVSGLLQWREFEAIAAITLERNGYVATRNLRFRHAGRRWEIDIVACKKPLVICADCKHWHHGIGPSTLRTVVKEQVGRAKAMAECLRNSPIRIECSLWSFAKVVPAIFSLTVGNIKLVDAVPVVPILQLQDFLGQLPAYVDSFEHFSLVSHGINERLPSEP